MKGLNGCPVIATLPSIVCLTLPMWTMGLHQSEFCMMKAAGRIDRPPLVLSLPARWGSSHVPRPFLSQAFDLGVQELHLQSWGDNVQKLSSVAFDLAGINPKQVVVKLPCTLEGIQVSSAKPGLNIKT